MRFLQRSLTARLLTLLLLLAIMPLVAMGILAYDSGRRSIIRNVEAHLESVAILKEQEIEGWVRHLGHTITWLAASPRTTGDAATLATHAAGDPEHLAAHDSLVAEFRRIAALGHLSPVFLLDSVSGQIIASSDASWEGQFGQTEPWFIQGRTGVHVSDMLHSLALGRPTIVVAAPVTGGDGQLLGVLAGYGVMEDLSEIMLERSGLGETGETYLVNEGNLLLTGVRFGPGEPFKKWVFTEGVARALEGESGVDLYLDYREAPVIGSYRLLEARGVALVAEVDQAEAFAPIVALRNSLLGIGVSAALAIAVLAVLLARSITVPVHQLVEGAEEFGRGNLDYRIKVKTRDEIGQLADAFSDMAANLSHSLGETAHGQRLVLALSQAAQAVQRARTTDEVYRTVTDQVTGLGYHAVIITLTEDRAHMVLAHHTFESRLLRAAEKLTGLLARDYRQPVDERHRQLISEGRTVFLGQMLEPMALSLPRLARPLLTRLSNMLGIEQGIYVPLKMGREVQGILIVFGINLTVADVPAMTAFGSQTVIALENAQLYERARHRAEELEQRVAERTEELADSQAAALNMMADADEARRIAERANEDLKTEIAERIRSEQERGRAVEALETHQEHLEELVAGRTAELSKLVSAMTGREVRMADLKGAIRKLRAQLEEAGLEPVADDPLLGAGL